MLDNVVDFVTNPIVVLVLLPIISLLFITSLFTKGLGIGGILGSILLVLFFAAHSIEGYSSPGLIFLFLIGVLFIFLELIIPGLIIGTIGFASISASILYTGADFMLTAYALAIALVVAILGMVILMKLFGKKMSVFNQMVLTDSTDTEKGYVSNVNRTELLQREAKTVTPLRPSGVVMLDGERLDVVSEGSFIDVDCLVVIIKVEGSRVVVREKKE
ncbi:NfeD family protein [Kurthia zopfii]|uniref:NfeD family protein n=1 Tax=Kurthia zopfii TaxID=1650 RepID=UPI000F71DCB3|nr:NfeD family protein [Kurthia zopfii]VEI07733.1 NfeD-like C-terminal, partner-binding [Kurthia zopfii]